LEAGIALEFARVCVDDTIPFDRRREAQALPNVPRIIEAATSLVAQ
jgi:pyruvate/2-oxoglutarate/acetoin dehydrogenase E1 component